ncbi:hypothetical protein HOLleu_08526 [Holothuria leucospilota]|uniref:Uncharacterized protein n=1 Tax=Holothuria leucospilota TaxID=206669 RepID=A0A9Q1CIF4_HOLLE|nr:hypothetical protein HOLleu_08526 [Holothuria leucospilota]
MIYRNCDSANSLCQIIYIFWVDFRWEMQPFDSADETLQREVFLNEKHENILLKRERLLKHAESFLDGQEQFQVTLNSHWQQAKKRNKGLLEDFKHYQSVFKERVEKPYSRNFVTLKEQYWSMVERELPGWKAEVKNSRRETPSPR